MNCKRCGTQISAKQQFCPRCGLPTAEAKLPGATAAAVWSTREPGELSGVGGWLLLLCILLTIVFPLNSLYGTARSLAYHPDATVLLLNATNVGLAILSLVAGTWLWRVRKNAVTLAKAFFLLSPLHAIGVFCLIIFGRHTYEALGMVGFALRILAFPFVLSLLWFWYLMQSRRVKNTYGAN